MILSVGVAAPIGVSQHRKTPKSGFSKIYREKVNRYNRAVIDYPPDYLPFKDMKCKDKLIKLLLLMEVRSKTHGGEMKWFTKEMAKEIKCSERTIYNYLKLLEKHNYITTLTDNKLAKSKHFYSIRIIRCNRIVLANNLKIQKGKIFKVDIRPQPSTSGFLPGTPQAFLEQNKTMDRIKMALNGYYDMTVDSMYREMLELAEFGDKEARKFIGWRPRVNEYGEAFV